MLSIEFPLLLWIAIGLNSIEIALGICPLGLVGNPPMLLKPTSLLEASVGWSGISIILLGANF